MWLRQWTVKIGIAISLGVKPAFIQWFSPKCHPHGIFNWRRVLWTHLLTYFLIWYEVTIGLKYRFWPYFIFIKVRNYLAPSCSADVSFQVRCPPANYVCGCHVTPVTRGVFGYVFYQKGIIQGHPGHRCPTREALGLGSRIVFRAVLSLDISTQTVCLYYMSVKYTLKGYLWCFFVSMIRTGCYVNTWNEINTVFQPFIGYIYGGTVEFWCYC